MLSAVNVITTCVDSKTQPASKQLHLRTVRGSNVKEKLSKWCDRINKKTGSTVTTVDLYKGEHWTVVKTLYDSARLRSKKDSLWIASAGYGLIGPNAQLFSYAATFSPNHKDSVNSRLHEKTPGDAARRWWKQMSYRRGPEHGMPRSLEEIANETPGRPMLVIASGSYVTAMHDDLLVARSRLNDPEKLIIISAGANYLGDLEKNRLPCDARMQTVVNGSRISLNARIGRKVLLESKKWPLRISPLRDHYNRLLTRQPEIKRYDRHPMTDAEVMVYVQKAIKHAPELSATRTLRKFRDDGYACEQKRFGKLFRKVQDDLYGA